MNKKRLTALLLAGCTCLNLVACGGSAPAASTAGNPALNSGSTGTVAAASTRPMLVDSTLFDTEDAVAPSVPTFEVAEDFSNVINYEQYKGYFSDEAKEMLRKNGFVVTGLQGSEFFTGYEMNRYDYKPNFVTTDSMMHTYHLYFSRLLKGVEKHNFADALAELGTAMLADSTAQYEALKGTEWENAAKRNMAFFAVGLKLVDPEADLPAEVADVAGEELALIREAGGIVDSPIMNLGGADASLGALQEDYTQYTPRGYYAGDETLSRYFQAMMWYGRLTFRQKDADQSRSALLMTLALKNSEALQKWSEIYTITSFFAGASDDPGLYEYEPLIESAYGSLPEVSTLAGNTDGWNKFAEALAQLAPPAINSIPIYMADDKDAVTGGFRFMGQRFTIDAAIFQQLVYRAVEANSSGDYRMLPSALDIPAALGSNSAQQILKNEGANDYAGYTENMTKVQQKLAEAPVSQWTNSLYASWLNTLRPLTESKGEGWPQFMQNAGWETKSLNSFLGSWTELKHDTVLYAKQNYAEMGGGPPDEQDDRGYVEPEYQLYDRLALLCRATSDGLSSYEVLADNDAENLGILEELARRLGDISRKELQNESLSDEDYELIRTYGGQLEHLWEEAMTDDEGNAPMSVQEYPSAVVTDVSTDPNGSVLEVGTGYVDNIYVIVNVEGSLRIANGAVYSFYEFEQPINERLTDEKWRLMLGIDWTTDGNNYQVDVPRPTWVKMFRAASDYE